MSETLIVASWLVAQLNQRRARLGINEQGPYPLPPKEWAAANAEMVGMLAELQALFDKDSEAVQLALLDQYTGPTWFDPLP